VVQQDQDVAVNGFINRKNYSNNYTANAVKLTEDFLTYEHTDGLNYVHLTIEKYQNLYQSTNKKIQLNTYYGGGVGVLVPKTNVKFLNYERNDRFHFSGYGLSASAGLQTTFFKYLMLRLEGKGGFINMPNIILHEKGIEGKGKQHFFFLESFVSIGTVFKL
jgi:hypothetical protein